MGEGHTGGKVSTQGEGQMHRKQGQIGTGYMVGDYKWKVEHLEHGKQGLLEKWSSRGLLMSILLISLKTTVCFFVNCIRQSHLKSVAIQITKR